MRLKFRVWSNVFFLIPLVMALYYDLFLHAGLIFAVMIFSTLFHINREKKGEGVDRFFALTLMAYNLYLIYLSGFRQPYLLLAIVLVAVAFYFYFRQKQNYDFNHSLWHLASVAITIVCILA
ncbi:MAG: hypothetical protein AAB373_04880 [Patescibacteria group bacterium]